MSSENSINNSSLVLLSELAQLVGGQLIGDSQCEITGIASVSEAQSTDISFLLDKRYLEEAKQSNAAAIVTYSEQPFLDNQIVVEQPRVALATLTRYFKFLGHPEQEPLDSSSIHSTAVLDDSVSVGKEVSIGAYCVIGKNVKLEDGVSLYSHVVIGDNCRVGKGSTIHPGVVIYDTINIGDNCTLHAGTVVGSDGFGYVQVKEGWRKIEHLGSVSVGANVEIGANSAIDRGCLGQTDIGAGTKIDNLVHVSHNVKIGQHCALAGQVGFVGGAELGDHVQVGGQAGFSLVKVASGSVVAAKAGVTKDIQEGAFVSGFPARSHAEELKTQAVLRKMIKDYQQKGVKK